MKGAKMIYNGRNRRLLVEFTCGRCGRTHTEPYEKQLQSTEGNLQRYKPPEDWKDDELYIPMLCSECTKELVNFMKGANDGNDHRTDN